MYSKISTRAKTRHTFLTQSVKIYFINFVRMLCNKYYNYKIMEENKIFKWREK